MERPYIAKSKPELTVLAESGDAAAKAELDYRANKKGGKSLTSSGTLTLEQRVIGIEQSQARCETMIREILELLLNEEDESDEDDDE